VISTQGPVRLRRGLGARLAGGNVPLLQTLLTLGLVVWVALLAITTFVVHPGLGAALRAAGPGLVVVALWLVGATAWAEVNDDGIRWRYYSTRTLPWSDVERVELGSRRVGAQAGEPVVRIQARGRRSLVTPASQCRRPALIEFGNAVADQAAAHGIEVAVDRHDHRWDAVADRPAR
jgi:hypothetical protein